MRSPRRPATRPSGTPRWCSPPGVATKARALKLIEAGVQDATARGEGRVIGLAGYATAVLYNGLGRYEAALAGARRACDHEDLGFFGWSLVELVEAGARSGAHDVAADALRQLEERTRAAGTDWALGILARSRALLSGGQAADALYREAIERLERSSYRRSSRPRPPAVRRVAAPREPARGCARATAYRVRDARPHRGRSVRRARPPRASGHRRDSAQAHGRIPRCSHRSGGAGRPARCRRAHQPRDRHPALHQPPHRRVPPAQGVHQARHQLAQESPRRAPGRRTRSLASVDGSPTSSCPAPACQGAGLGCSTDAIMVRVLHSASSSSHLTRSKS